MDQARNSAECVGDAICDGLRQIGDFTYAILPKDIAHALGELEKAVLSQVRCAVDWKSDWVDERVAGGDKLREEWKEKCRPGSAEPVV
jgi:hypothetical protein